MKLFAARVIRYRTLLFMVAPAILFFLIFSYLPMLGIVVAFQDYNLRDKFLSPFNGINNFRFLFLSSDILGVVRNTVLYNLAIIGLGNLFQIGCAIMLAELAGKWFKKITQSFMIFPYFISWVIVGAFAYNVFNYDTGLINSMIRSFGLESVDIYNSPAWWPFIIVSFAVWKGLGYGTVIYLAAIMGIDQEMYEAAQIDGASMMQRIFKITIPCLIPTIIILLLLSLGGILRGDFNMFYQLVGNNFVLLPYTDVIDTFVTRSLLTSNDIGMPAAAGLLQSVFGFVLIVTVNALVRRYEKDYSLF